ncbi:MAG: hypothetical protein DI587_31315 [Variovorax paradoxus]|nr:MAG: hypothetical protein DI583_31315 [Variovorax paradoxus]PZQ03150.1 MAG: hypothetical protein DI587_31315 [Variovorax paradoxus]
MNNPVDEIPRATKFLTAAACAYDASPDTPVKLQVRAAVEALVRAAQAQPQVSAAMAEQLARVARDDPWSVSSAILAADVLDTIPEDQWVAALVSAGIAEAADPVELHPMFIAAGEELSRIYVEQGPDAVNAPQHAHLIEQLMQYGPERQQGISDYFRSERDQCRVLH